METVFTKEIFGTIIIIISSVAFYMIVRQILIATFVKVRKKANKKTLTIITVSTNVLKYTLFIADLLMTLDIWGVDTKALLTSLGVVGVIVGLALQDLLKDLISGTAILTEDQFKVGDNIQVGTFRGDVIYLGLKTTKIRAYTGEVKIIANRNITEVTNYSIQNAKSLIDIATSYEDDIEKVRKALETVCETLSKDKKHLSGKIEILGVQDLADSEIVFRLIAETKPNHDKDFRRIALEEIIKEFKKQKLTIPYPQMEVHNEK